MTLADVVHSTAGEDRALQRLGKALRDPESKVERPQAIAEAARELARILPSTETLVRRIAGYIYICRTYLDNWPSVEIRDKAQLRELALQIGEYMTGWDALAAQDRDDLTAALPDEARDRFLVSQHFDRVILSQILAAMKDDADLRGVPSSRKVWELALRIDPIVEELLRLPLDPTKFVERAWSGRLAVPSSLRRPTAVRQIRTRPYADPRRTLRSARSRPAS